MTPAASPRPQPRDAFLAAGVFLAVLVAYFPALRAGLIWNDPDYLTKPALRSLAGLGRIWFQLGATEQYYPVLHSAFWLEHRLWGEAPLGYHLINVLLHATAACLFALVLRRLTGERTWPWLAALLFALHPVGVESVAWISEQKNTLSTVFYLAAALVYGRWAQPGAARSGSIYGIASGLFVLALLSKSVTATLPAALLLALWWRQGRLAWKADVFPLLPWLAAGATMGLFSAWVERTYIGAEGAHFALTLGQRAAVAGHAFWFYVGHLLWPARLIFIYPRWNAAAAGAGSYFYPLAVAAAGAGLAVYSRRNRAPLAAFLFFLGSLFPTLGFFNVYAFVFSYVADHWQYLASLGFFALVAAGWSRLFRGGAVLAVVAVLFVLGLLTWRQCRMYRDVETLYRVTLARNPGSWLAHTNLGSLLQAEGHGAEAVAEFRAALQISPEYPEIHANLADALVAAGRSDEAVKEYEAAIRLSPAYPAAQVNLANTLVRAGRDEAAIPHSRAALQLRPADAALELGLGAALAKVGRAGEAAAHDEAALRLRPNFPEAEYEWGNTLANGGQLEAAMAHYRQALRLRADYPGAQTALGLALATAGRPTDALVELTAVLRRHPDSVEAHAYCGLALARLGRLREAVAEYRAALRLAPGAADVHYQLALVLRNLGEMGEAAAEFEAADRPPARSP